MRTMKLRVLIPARSVERKIKKMGARIAEKYAGQTLILLCILKGAKPFCDALEAAILAAGKGVDVRVDHIQISSYEGTSSSGKVEILIKPELDLRGQNVLVVEDIIDTGLSMTAICSLLKECGPKSVQTAALLDKKCNRKAESPFEAEYVGFTIENHFVVGFGLDYKDEDGREWFRKLPAICVLDLAA